MTLEFKNTIKKTYLVISKRIYANGTYKVLWNSTTEKTKASNITKKDYKELIYFYPYLEDAFNN